MVGPFALDGYDVLAPFDAAGRSWRAVCAADGHRVVLRRWVGGAAHLAEIRRRAALWGSLSGGGVVAVRDVVALGEDVVVVTELAVGGGLDALVARRRSLTPGQIVTLVAPMAETLAAAHDRGLVHGRISMNNVVLDQDGRPMLTDWLLAGDGDPVADVMALVALALQCLGDEAPETLLAQLRSATDARMLADQLLSALPAEPLFGSLPREDVLPPARQVPTTATRGVLTVVAVAVALAIGGGVIWGRHDSAVGGQTLTPPPIPTPTSASDNVDWFSVVRHLERQRIRALVNLDTTSLATCELRGTALWHRDGRTLSQLRSAHAHVRGLRVHVDSVLVRSVAPRRLVVRVVDALSSYDVVDHRGVVVEHHSERRSRAAVMRLTRRGGGWLIARVSRQSR